MQVSADGVMFQTAKEDGKKISCDEIYEPYRKPTDNH